MSDTAATIFFGSLATGACYLFYKLCYNSAKNATHIVKLLENLPTRDVAGAKKDLQEMESRRKHEAQFVKILAEVAPAHQQVGKVRSHFQNTNIPIKEGALYEMKIIQRNLILQANLQNKNSNSSSNSSTTYSTTTTTDNNGVGVTTRIEETLSHHYNIGVLPLVLKDKKNSSANNTLVIERFPDSFLLSDTYPAMAQVSESYLPHLPISSDVHSEAQRLVTIHDSGKNVHSVHTDASIFLNSNSTSTSNVVMGYLVKEYLLPFGSSLLALGKCYITPSGTLSMTKTLVLTNKSERDIINEFKSSASLSHAAATIFKLFTVGAGVYTGAVLLKFILKSKKDKRNGEDDDSKRKPKQQED